MNSKSDRFWGAFGRISAVIATIGSGIAVVSHFMGPSAYLKAVVSFGSLDYPPVLNEAVGKVEALRHSLELSTLLGEGLLKALDEGTPPATRATTEKELAQRFALRERLFKYGGIVSSYIDAHIPHDISQYKEMGGLWRAAISNDGDLQCSSIGLTLPGASSALIVRDDGSKVTRDIQDVVDLGDLRPGGRISVLAWARRGPIIWEADRVEVTHSKGRGRVEVRSEAGGVALFVERYVNIWFVMMVICGLSTLVIIASGVVVSVSSRKPAIDVVATKAAAPKPGRSRQAKKISVRTNLSADRQSYASICERIGHMTPPTQLVNDSHPVQAVAHFHPKPWSLSLLR